MLICDGIFEWSGWGPHIRHSRGRCRLRIFDETHGDSGRPIPLRPIVVVIEETPGSDMSPVSWIGHIATRVRQRHRLAASRTLWVVHWPRLTYGVAPPRRVPARLEAVDFTWHADKALSPHWYALPEPLRRTVEALLAIPAADIPPEAG